MAFQDFLLTKNSVVLINLWIYYVALLLTDYDVIQGTPVYCKLEGNVWSLFSAFESLNSCFFGEKIICFSSSIIFVDDDDKIYIVMTVMLLIMCSV